MPRPVLEEHGRQTIIAPSGVFGSTVAVPLSNPFLTAAQRNSFCANDDFDTGALPARRCYTPAQCAAAATATSPTDPNYPHRSRSGLSRRTTGSRAAYVRLRHDDVRLSCRRPRRHHRLDRFRRLRFAYGESARTTQTTRTTAADSRVRSGVYATSTTSSDDVPAAARRDGCVPVNIFGPGGVDHARRWPLPHRQQHHHRVGRRWPRRARTINGDFGWNLPWASEPVGFAVGGEYREYTASQRPTRWPDGGRTRRRRRRGSEHQRRLRRLRRLRRSYRADRLGPAVLRGADSSRPASAIRTTTIDAPGNPTVQHHHLEGGGHLGAGRRTSSSAAITSARSARRTSPSCSRRSRSA